MGAYSEGFMHFNIVFNIKSDEGGEQKSNFQQQNWHP